MVSIKIKDLCIDFPIFSSQSLSIRNALAGKLVGGTLAKDKSSYKTVRALDGINLDVKAGDRIGLVGHNGSGKSTLLRALAGIYPPTSGSIEAQGKVSTLFGTSASMNGDMTGYENLFLNSLIFSGDYKRTKKQMDSMAEFTELGDYLNLPMNTYSEGMKVRIGFASATNFVPDILLIDEVFGAGDKSFSEKSNQRMNELIDNSHILFFASHSDGLLKKFCNKGLYLSKGKVVEFDNIDKVLSAYNVEN